MSDTSTSAFQREKIQVSRVVRDATYDLMMDVISVAALLRLSREALSGKTGTEVADAAMNIEMVLGMAIEKLDGVHDGVDTLLMQMTAAPSEKDNDNGGES